MVPRGRSAAISTHRSALPSTTFAARAAMVMAGRGSWDCRGIRRFEDNRGVPFPWPREGAMAELAN